MTVFKKAHFWFLITYLSLRNHNFNIQWITHMDSINDTLICLCNPILLNIFCCLIGHIHSYSITYNNIPAWMFIIYLGHYFQTILMQMIRPFQTSCNIDFSFFPLFWVVFRVRFGVRDDGLCDTERLYT